MINGEINGEITYLFASSETLNPLITNVLLRGPRLSYGVLI